MLIKLNFRSDGIDESNVHINTGWYAQLLMHLAPFSIVHQHLEHLGVGHTYQ